MSKKIIKRSLALGALMAFVITGSAMAAEIDSLFTGGPYSFKNESEVFNVTNGGLGHTAVVVEAKEVNITSPSNGINAYGHVNVFAVGDITIESKSNGIMLHPDSKNESQGVTIEAGGTLTIGGTGYGIHNERGIVDIDAGKIVVTNTNGITNNGTGAMTLDATGDISVNTSGYHSVISLGAGGIELNAGGDIAITNSGTYSSSTAVRSGKGNIVINAAGNTIVEGNVKAEGVGNILIDAVGDTTIDGTVQGADGLKSQIDLKGNNVTIAAKAITPSETEGAVRNVSIDAKGKVTINAEGLCGVGAGPDKATMAQAMNSIKAKEINITSDNAFGIYANNHSYYAVGTRVHSYLEAETINIESKKDGIYASNGAVTEVKGFKTLNVTSTGEQGIGSEYGHLTFVGGDVVVTSAEEGIRSKLGGELKFDVDSLKVDAGLESIKLTGDSVLNIKAKTVQLDGDITTETAKEKNPTLTAAFNDAESYLNGKVTTVDGAQTNLTFNKGATWNVTGASKVSTLNSNEGKFVFINDSHVDIDAGSGNINLTMADQTADNLNDAAGLTTVAEKLGVSEAAKETITAKVVMAEGDVKGETTGDVVFEDLGEDKYYHGEVKEVTEKVNTKNQAIGDAGVALKLHWRSHVNDMNKRMGELRNAEGEHGVWTRVVRGESEYKNTKAQYNQYQLGYDEKLSVDKRWTVGAAVTFAEGDANYGQGSTDDKSTAFAIYGSKLNNDGTFVDLIARYAHLESDLDDVNSGKGNYSTNGMSVSAEFGKRIQQGKGLWVEPQVELTYGTIDSAEFIFDGGKTVQVGDMDSLIGRVGFRIGKDLEQGNVYARASYLYDFEGETENTFSNATDSRTIAEDLGGGWWEVGVGANINLSKATYIYADVEKTFGGEVDTNWQWNLGVRYSF